MRTQRLRFQRLVDPATDQWRSLMALYVRTFEPAQRETEDGIVRNLCTPRNDRAGGHVVISALNADGPCVGGIIFSALSLIECGYVSYVFVDERSRRTGLGSRLLAEMRAYLQQEAGAGSVRGVFAEIETPGSNVVSQLRLRFWERNGVRPLAVEWHYPSLQMDLAAVPSVLAFGSYRSAGEVWYPRQLEEVARAIFDATYSYLPSAPVTLGLILDGVRKLPRDLPVAYGLPG